MRQQAQAFARLPRRFCFSFKRRVSPFNKRAKSEAIGLVSFWTPTPPLKLMVEVKLRVCREARELGEFRKRWEPALWVRLWVPLVSTPTHSRYFHSARRRDPQGPGGYGDEPLDVGEPTVRSACDARCHDHGPEDT